MVRPLKCLLFPVLPLVSCVVRCLVWLMHTSIGIRILKPSVICTVCMVIVTYFVWLGLLPRIPKSSDHVNLSDKIPLILKVGM